MVVPSPNPNTLTATGAQVAIEDTLRRRIRALEIALAALTLRYGDPQAELPPSVILTIPQGELVRAERHAIDISPQQHDIEPEPFLLIKVQAE